MSKKNELKNDWRIVYIIVYTMFLSQNLNEKWVRKIYNSIYYVSQSKFEWKINKKNELKNDWRIVYNSIYYVSQSKIWVKNEWKNDSGIIYKLYTMIFSQKFEWKMK